MYRLLWLLLLPVVVWANKVSYVERPQFTFQNTPYRLVEFYRDTVKHTEEYLPQGMMSEDFMQRVRRVEYYQVSDFNAAAQSRIWSLQEEVGQFPHELVIDKEKDTAMLNAAFWRAPRPGVLEKYAMIFKINPKLKDVVAYEYHERQFVSTDEQNIEALKAADKTLLFDQSVIDALVKLGKKLG